MLFSVIIPVYNYAQYLPEAVQSVLDQPGDDYEVIIVDDGSEDNSAEVAQKVADESAGKIRFIHQENQGPGAARNTGIREACGDYCLFLDADDRLTSNALDSFRAVLAQRQPFGMVVAGHVSIHDDGRRREHRPPNCSDDHKCNFESYLRKKIGVSNGASIIQRQVFSSFAFPVDIRNGEDVAVFAKIFALYDCVSIPDMVLEIRKHDDSLRHQIELILASGDRVVDYIFDPILMPAWAMAYRNEFAARQTLSLFRSSYLAGQYPQARKLYRAGVKMYPSLLFNLSYLRKYLRILLK